MALPAGQGERPLRGEWAEKNESECQSREMPPASKCRPFVRHWGGYGACTFSGMERVAMLAHTDVGTVVEALEQRWQVGHDIGQLDFDPMHQVMAIEAVPLECVEHPNRTLALDHQTAAPGLWTLRRVAHVRRQQENIALLQIDAFQFSLIHDVQPGVAFELVEEFFQRVVMEIGAMIRPANDGHHEIRVLPDLLVVHGRLEQLGVMLQPVLKIEWSSMAQHDKSPLFMRRRLVSNCPSLEEGGRGWQWGHGERGGGGPAVNEKLAVDLVVAGEVIHVDQKSRDVDDLFQIRTDALQDVAQVRYHCPCLHPNIQPGRVHGIDFDACQGIVSPA